MTIRTIIHIIRQDIRKTYKAQSLKLKYRKTLCRLRKQIGQRRIIVAFCVSEIAKWKSMSLYNKLKGTSTYHPVIFIYPSPLELNQEPSNINISLEEKIVYFKNKGLEVVNIWNNDVKKCVIPLENQPDIIFYQQPWDIPPFPAPTDIADYALSFYIPYYLINNLNIHLEFGFPLHYQVFCYIVQNKEVARFYTSILKRRHYASKCIGLGHPAIDNLTTKELSIEERSVIYAPHFSFPAEGIERDLTYSTFLENGKLILEFAKQHPGIRWIFKPHPRLRYELKDTGVWSEAEIESYYADWAKIGVVCTTADYAEYFQNSFAMITDCGSFLTEYSCMDKPLIRLYYYEENLPPNPMLKKLYKTFYYAHNNDELAVLLENIICQRQDPNKIERHQEVVRLRLNRGDSSQRIIDYLNSLLSSRKASKL